MLSAAFLRAFFLRLKAKSALQFSFVAAAITLPFLGVMGALTFSIFFNIWFFCFLIFYYANLCLNSSLRRQPNGVLCPICGAKSSHLLFPERRRHCARGPGGFSCTSFDHASYPNILYCPFCRNGYLEKITAQHFEQTRSEGLAAYHDVIDEKYLAHLPGRRATYRKFLDQYGACLKNKKILEIGCYYGAFTQMLEGLVTDYVGVEPSKHAAHHTQSHFPKWKIHHSDIDGFINTQQTSAETFDVIVMFDVIEHLPNPLQATRQLRKFLSKDGLLIFSTINMEASLSLAMGGRWPWLMDMHYFYFSDRGLVSLLHRAGYSRLQHSHFPYVVSAKYFVEKVAGLLGIPARRLLDMTPECPLTIRLGDTVLVVGQNGEA